MAVSHAQDGIPAPAAIAPGVAAWRHAPPWYAVALGAGILGYFALRTEPEAWLGWLAAPLIAAGFAAFRRAPWAGFALGCAGAAALGFAAAAFHAGRAPPPLDVPARAILVSGTVERVDLLPEGRRVTLREARFDGAEPLARTVRLRLRANDPAAPAPGDRVTVRALLRPPAPPAAPGAWDFQRNAYFSGLGASGFAIGPAAVQPGEARAPPLAGWRTTIETRVTTALPGAVGAIAAALLTGGVSAIPPNDLAALRDSGLQHLLSVSGLHVSIVMGLAFFVVRFLIACWPWLCLRVPGKAWAAVAALAAGGFYLVLTGAQVPMQRAFAMAAIVTLGIILARQAVSARTLAIAAAIVLLANPAALLGPSFQMSFAAVLALIAAWEVSRRRVHRFVEAGGAWRRPLIWAAGLVLTSVVAGFATTPYGLHHFGRLQLYGVVANAIAVPATSLLVMPAGMAALLLMPLGLENLALVPMGWGVQIILWAAHTVAGWPGAAQSAVPIPGWGLALFSAGLLVLCLIPWRVRLAGVALMAAGLASGAAVRAPDVLVSADARLIAFHAGGAVWVERASGASNLTRESWLRQWGEEGARPLPREGAVAEGAIACTPAGCRWSTAAGAVWLARAPARRVRPDVPPAECEGLVLIVSAEPLGRRCRGVALVDRFSVWRDGAHAARLTAEGLALVSDRAHRGERPWVPPIPRPRNSREPPAETM